MELGPVFRALSDPTRREILDVLRESPRTTGELAALFPTTRFAVMKHLGILNEAGLVLSAKKGRERWHRLNAVPLQQMYERWVRPYEAKWASPLLRLKEHVERKNKMKVETAQVMMVEVEIAIAAARSEVWRAFIEDIGTWWPRDFHIGGAKSKMILEPVVGGRMYEDWGGGAGLLWCHIISIVPHEQMECASYLFPRFGGPASSLITFALEEKGSETVLRISDSMHGRIGAGADSQKSEGWRYLFGALKQHVEGSGGR